jgi:hypothetical protein
MRKLVTLTAAAALAAAFGSGTGSAGTFNPVTDSQGVDCNQVDKILAHIPNGDGDGTVTDAETGPGGWRFNSGGRSFVTFAHTLNGLGDGYDVDAGRSNVAANAGIINDYPASLDLPQSALDGVIVFKGRRGEITLTGDTANDPPLFALPGAGEGQVRINLHDPDGDGIFEGCASSPLLKNFGFVKPEGGDFVQSDYFKAYADTDTDGTVTFFEWTEVSTFKHTVPGFN